MVQVVNDFFFFLLLRMSFSWKGIHVYIYVYFQNRKIKMDVYMGRNIEKFLFESSLLTNIVWDS